MPGDYVRKRASGSSRPLRRDPPSTWSVSPQSGTRVIPSGLREQRKEILMQMGLRPDRKDLHGKDLQFARDFAMPVAFADAGQINLQR